MAVRRALELADRSVDVAVASMAARWEALVWDAVQRLRPSALGDGDPLIVVARTLRRLAVSRAPDAPGLGELVVGLTLLRRAAASTGVASAATAAVSKAASAATVDGPSPRGFDPRRRRVLRGATARDVALRLVYEARLAEAAYAGRSYLTRSTLIRSHRVLVHEPSSAVGRPAHLLAIDDATRRIVVALRGTATVGDALVNLAGVGDPFNDGYAHRGALLSARWARDTLGPAIRRASAEHPGYTVQVRR